MSSTAKVTALMWSIDHDDTAFVLTDPVDARVTDDRPARRRRRRLHTRGHLRAAQIVAPGTLELIDDLAALREEAPGFLGAGEEERAEPELVAQPPGADQIAVREAPAPAKFAGLY